jgi:DNA/RNA-binding domain of Phe-tRNA-synthetase-like protein
MRELALRASWAWSATYPGACVGVLALADVVNPSHSAALEERKAELERALRARFAGLSRADLRALPTLQAYEAYYRRFQKTYHVQLQLESVALRGKSIPRVAALVEAMFMAELQNQLLTAGHDLAALDPPLRLDVAHGTEVYTLYNGQEQQLKPGDMYVADQRGIISNVIYGPDQRTRIADPTRGVLFTVYGVPGIDRDAMDRHLADLVANAHLVAPVARIVWQQVVGGA